MRSPSAYRVTPLDQEWRVLLYGTPYEIETFVGQCMRDGDERAPATKFKHLLVVVPMRDPAQYGLTATQVWGTKNAATFNLTNQA